MCEQALALDDGGLYKERLEVLLHRLELRAQLYKQPEKAEDIAAMIIEQVCGVITLEAGLQIENVKGKTPMISI